MNGLKIAVIILLSVGIAAFLYNLLALQPNLENQYAIGPVTITTTDTDYRMQSDITGLSGSVLMGLAALLALFGFFKSKQKLFLVFTGLGTVGAIAIVVVAFGRVM